jgi:hypothetical protein
MEPHPRGRLKIYEQPQEGHKYVLFADVAEGKATEGIGEDKSKWDFSCAQILKMTSWPPAIMQAAIWHGNCDPDQFGSILVALAKLYFNAYLGWEINGPGRSLGLQVIDKHRYGNIYMREDYDSITKRPTKKPGWRTTRRTKPDMVAISQRFVRQGEIIIYDGPTLSEMKAFARVSENKYEAAQGKDDRVIGLAGALAIGEPLMAYLKRVYDKEQKKKELKEFDPDLDIFKMDDEEEIWNPVLGSEW